MANIVRQRELIKAIMLPIIMKRFYLLPLLALAVLSSEANAEAEIKLGVLTFGTVNWELETIKHLGLDKTNDLTLTVKPVANPQAAKIALQAGSVDVIVSDFIWVSHQREKGVDIVFAPYSTTAGALMLPSSSKVGSIKDLVGMKLGVAGGSLDKNWLLLNTLAAQEGIEDFDKQVEKTFGAPPLLNQQLERGNIDALLNYWHYAAGLEAKGFKRLIDGHQILSELGIKEKLPTLGYVFNKSWGEKNNQAIYDFLNASIKAKDSLCESDPAWEHVRDLTQAQDEKTLKALRQRYCEGRIQSWSDKEKLAADQVIKLLHQSGHSLLTGKTGSIQPDTFWPNTPYPGDQP